MQSPSPSAAAPPPQTRREDATSSEVVTRPEPGLARGKWEAPAWGFWAILAVIVLGSAAYVLYRAGVLRRRRRDPSSDPSMTPMSSKRRRP